MTYKQMLVEAYTRYWREYARVKFIGYNTAKGSRMYGTLVDVPESACIESPVAENLMVGMAAGMSLAGARPVVCFERHDFILIGLDSLVNHVDKMSYLSGDQFKMPVLVRAIVGAKEPLNPGPQHTQDYTTEISLMLKHTPVFKLNGKESRAQLKAAIEMVGKSSSGAVVVVEYRELYDKELDTLSLTTTSL